jgi:hypothetical protein
MDSLYKDLQDDVTNLAQQEANAIKQHKLLMNSFKPLSDKLQNLLADTEKQLKDLVGIKEDVNKVLSKTRQLNSDSTHKVADFIYDGFQKPLDIYFISRMHFEISDNVYLILIAYIEILLNVHYQKLQVTTILKTKYTHIHTTPPHPPPPPPPPHLK